MGGTAGRILEMGAVREVEKVAVRNEESSGWLGRGLFEEVGKGGFSERKKRADGVLQRTERGESGGSWRLFYILWRKERVDEDERCDEIMV